MLHVALNCTENLFSDFLLDFMGFHNLCSFGSKESRNYGSLSPDHPIKIVAQILFESLARRLYYGIKKCWDTNGKSLKEFDRFQGFDIEIFCKNFHRITSALHSFCKTDFLKFSILGFFHKIGFLFCKIVRDMSHICTTVEILENLEENCQVYHTLKARYHKGRYFYQNDFMVGYIILYQAKKLFERFPGLGLGVASMQACEHKHEVIKHLLTMTQTQLKWFHVLEYDEILCHYLPVELDFETSGYVERRAKRYSPAISPDLFEGSFLCGWSECQICSHPPVWPVYFDSERRLPTVEGTLNTVKMLLK